MRAHTEKQKSEFEKFKPRKARKTRKIREFNHRPHGQELILNHERHEIHEKEYLTTYHTDDTDKRIGAGV